MTTVEASKSRSRTLIDGVRSATWSSWLAVVLIAVLVVMLAVQAVQEPAQFASQLVIGITNGAIIALVALGYTLVYGIIELINFAHGDNFMIGSFVGLTVLSGTFAGIGFFAPISGSSGFLLKVAGVLIAMAVAMVACGLLGVGIERVAYKPLRNSPRLAVLITAIGMSFILQNVGLVWKGPAQVPFPELISDANILPTDAVVFRWKDLFVIGVTIPLLVALSYFIGSTKQGKAMRAVAQDKEAASMVGINVNRTISITFLLGGILAGASGVMYGLFNGITVFNVGFTQGLYAFTAAVLGGIGNLTGAVVGGFLIGIIGSMADQYIGVRWTAIVIFAVLILVLVFRPTGLLGDRSAVQGVASSAVAVLRKYGIPAVLIVAAFLFPLVDEAFELDLLFPAIIIAIYILLALGLNIVVGFAGLLDLGFVAFYALGAYAVGWFASTQFSQVTFSFGSTATSLTGGEVPGIHISFWILLFVAAAFAGLCGVIIGAPTLRLRGDYLAIVTLGFGEIIPRFFQNGDDLGGFNLTNGTIGIKAIDSPGIQILPDSFDAWQRFSTLYLHPWYYTILVLVLITVYVNIRLRDSRLGRAWISVREDETAAAAMGINPVTTKLWAYALGGVFGGLAGAFYGAFIKNIFPDAFSFNISIIVLCMVILGGMGNIYGVILGAILLQGLNFYLLPQINEWVHAIGNALGSPLLSQADIPKYNFFLFGVILVLMMLLRPEGIIPNRQRAEELRSGEGGDVGDALGGNVNE